MCCVGGRVWGREAKEWGGPLVPKELNTQAHVRDAIQGLKKKGKPSRSVQPCPWQNSVFLGKRKLSGQWAQVKGRLSWLGGHIHF